MDEKKIIKDYITELECRFNCDGEMFDCDCCCNLKECYVKAIIRCDEEFAKSVDYGGCNDEEDFWEQIYG